MFEPFVVIAVRLPCGIGVWAKHVIGSWVLGERLLLLIGDGGTNLSCKEGRLSVRDAECIRWWKQGLQLHGGRCTGVGATDGGCAGAIATCKRLQHIHHSWTSHLDRAPIQPTGASLGFTGRK